MNAPDDERIAAYAAALRAAALERSPIPPLTESDPSLTLSAAYAIQSVNIEQRVRAGARVIGHKVGLTSRAMQEMLGVAEPDYGKLLDNMLVAPDAETNVAEYCAPRAEVETAFILERGLGGPDVTEEDVIAVTSAIVPAIEIIDSRIADWRITLVDTVADNASSAAFVLGEARVSPSTLDLSAIEATLYRNGEVADRGRSSAVLGHPATAVAWLARTLHQHGAAIEAGAVVLPGACTRAIPVRAGDHVMGVFEGLGSVSVRFP